LQFANPAAVNQLLFVVLGPRSLSISLTIAMISIPLSAFTAQKIVMFTRPRRPTQDLICPFVYHYFMTFLKQKTPETQLKAIKMYVMPIGIPAQR